MYTCKYVYMRAHTDTVTDTDTLTDTDTNAHTDTVTDTDTLTDTDTDTDAHTQELLTLGAASNIAWIKTLL